MDNKPSPIIIPIESIEVYESFCGRTMIFYSIIQKIRFTMINDHQNDFLSIAKDYFQHDMNNRPSPESRFMIFLGHKTSKPAMEWCIFKKKKTVYDGFGYCWFRPKNPWIDSTKKNWWKNFSPPNGSNKMCQQLGTDFYSQNSPEVRFPKKSKKHQNKVLVIDFCLIILIVLDHDQISKSDAATELCYPILRS